MADEIVAGNNKKLFENAVKNFASVENSVSIPVKSYYAGLLTVPALEFIFAGLILVLVLPLGLLITGLIIWLQRRKR